MKRTSPLDDTRKRLASAPLMEKLRLLESVSEKVNAGAKRSPEVTSKLDGPSIVGGELATLVILVRRVARSAKQGRTSARGLMLISGSSTLLVNKSAWKNWQRKWANRTPT